jgi:hypothetical protein
MGNLPSITTAGANITALHLHLAFNRGYLVISLKEREQTGIIDLKFRAREVR